MVHIGVSKWLLLAIFLAGATFSESTKPRVVCYYTNWSVYRPAAGKYPTKTIDPQLCTHLNYAFGGFSKDSKIRPSDGYQDIDMGGYSTFTGLKNSNPELKTMLSLGGNTEGSATFSYIGIEPERRREFVQNSIKFLRDNNFDGLDLDWGQPSFGLGGKPEDKSNYAKLIKELREAFEAEATTSHKARLLLSVAIHRDPINIDKGFDIPQLTKHVDWMNVRAYDYSLPLDPTVNHHTPLYASDISPNEEDNANHTIQYLISAGADRDKLVLGMPTYGRTLTLSDPQHTNPGSAATGPGEKGVATGERGYFSYYEICDNLKDGSGWTKIQPNSKTMGPYAFKGDQWVSYDDIHSVILKAEYAAQQGLGGIMFWTIDNDDFNGNCHGIKYPLIKAAKEALNKNVVK